jgi:transcriptional regulator with XRE-family HTH domain
MALTNIKSERVRLGLGTKNTADAIGVHENTLRNWESGSVDIPASALVTMSKMFGCSIEYLLGLVDERLFYSASPPSIPVTERGDVA